MNGLRFGLPSESPGRQYASCGVDGPDEDDGLLVYRRKKASEVFWVIRRRPLELDLPSLQHNMPVGFRRAPSAAITEMVGEIHRFDDVPTLSIFIRSYQTLAVAQSGGI